MAPHIYCNRDGRKSLHHGPRKSVLRVLDLKNFPYRMKAVKTQAAGPWEIWLSEDNRTWYLTCIGA
jgi:hypothetical protein